MITLDHEPPSRWIHHFNHPTGGHSEVHGHGPSQFRLRGKVLEIGAPEYAVEDIANNVPQYIKNATRGLAAKLQEEAEQEERQERKALAARVAEEEKRLRVIARLNKIVSPG
jgi:hypothetical protein